jgi:uncharacterized protein YlbG (UPF0298 family)
MKIWLDKHGGMHYHKEGCKFTQVKHPNSEYEEVEHKVRQLGNVKGHQYTRIKVDDRYYMPCPLCFGDMRIR